MSSILSTFRNNEKQSSVPNLYDDLERGPVYLFARESQSAPNSFHLDRYKQASDSLEGERPNVPSGMADQHPNHTTAFREGSNDDRANHTAGSSQRRMSAVPFIPSPGMEQLGEFAWSPPQSESGDDVIVDRLSANRMRSISSTDLSWIANSEQGDNYEPLMSSPAVSGKAGVNEPTLPRISLTVPGSRFSGIISDGTSQRAMSDAELRGSLSSIEDIINSNLRRDESSSSQMGPMATFGDNEADYLHPASSIDDPGPGSLQSGSSQSAGQLRGSTSPLLSGRHAVSNASPQPSRSNSRLGQVMKAHGVRKDGRLGRVYQMNSVEQDWETVSDVREIGAHHTSENATEALTGSSLADNSDSGEISLPKQETLNDNSDVLGHLSRPRLNQSYMIVKDHQTGQSYSVPQSEYELRSQVPNSNAALSLLSTARSRVYHHPIPLSEGHTHPFTSPPAVLVPPEQLNLRLNGEIAQQTAREPYSMSSDMSDDDQKLNNQRESIYELTKPASKASEVEMNEIQRQLGSKERSYHSSTWVSTQSDDGSGAYALPPIRSRQGSFARVTTLGAKGNITGSPDGTGAREVGSSLADASSLGAQFSSSPAPFIATPSSQCQPSVKANANQTPASGTLSRSETTNFAVGLGDIGDLRMPRDKDEWIKAIPPRKLREPDTILPDRRRRSSSESERDNMASPKITSVRESSILYGHAKSNTTAGLLDDTASVSLHPNLRERHVHIDTRSSSSTEPRPFRRCSGVVYTDVPAPEFIHPVYGRDRPEVTHIDRGRTIFQDPAIRPLARFESPHLYRVPRPITLELLKRRKHISTLYLVICCCIPFMALAYGYGLLDWVINAHMDGDIEGWNEGHVTFARIWAPVIIVGYIIAIGIVWVVVGA